MEQAAEREEFERKVSKITLSQTVPHVPCDVFLLNSIYFAVIGIETAGE